MDIIEKHFMERIETHLSVLEDWQLDPRSYEHEEPPFNRPSIRACRDTLNKAKNYMKMLNKYQRLKNE